MNLKPRFLKSSSEIILILKKTYKSKFVPSLLFAFYPFLIWNKNKKRSGMMKGDEDEDEEDGGRREEEDRYHRWPNHSTSVLC